jgi:pilus assembly protein CpaE
MVLMTPLRIALLGPDSSYINILQGRLGHGAAAEVVFANGSLPLESTTSILQSLQRTRPDVVLLGIAPEAARTGLRAIEVLHAACPNLPIVAVGAMGQPTVIVDAMRSGACDFLDRDAEPTEFSEALMRLVSSQDSRLEQTGERGTICAVYGGKGGDGATTVATNLAVALQALHGKTALVDMAPLGHAALQLDVRANFGVTDALENLHRLDASLIQALMISCAGGLGFLAGPTKFVDRYPDPKDVARLFQRLSEHYQYVIVDCSGGVNPANRAVAGLSSIVLLVAQANVVSLWGVAQGRSFLSEETDPGKLRLVLNRCRKNQGLKDEDAEAATKCSVFWKIPNDFHTAGPAIDRGIPVARENSGELSRSFRGLAAEILRWKQPDKQGTQSDKIQPKSKLLERLIEVTTPATTVP